MFMQHINNRTDLRCPGSFPVPCPNDLDVGGRFLSRNGDMNNNIIMHPAIAQGEVTGETCITTAVWDWSPLASWDSGKHWPSWQTEDDGAGMGELRANDPMT